jgi:hypothetical protein
MKRSGKVDHFDPLTVHNLSLPCESLLTTLLYVVAPTINNRNGTHYLHIKSGVCVGKHYLFNTPSQSLSLQFNSMVSQAITQTGQILWTWEWQLLTCHHGNHETVSYEQFQEITFCFDSKVCFSCLQREALTSSLAADERLFSCHLSRIFVFTASQLQNHQFQGHATPHLH